MLLFFLPTPETQQAALSLVQILQKMSLTTKNPESDQKGAGKDVAKAYAHEEEVAVKVFSRQDGSPGFNTAVSFRSLPVEWSDTYTIAGQKAIEQPLTTSSLIANASSNDGTEQGKGNTGSELEEVDNAFVDTEGRDHGNHDQVLTGVGAWTIKSCS